MEDTRKKLCELLESGEEESFRVMVDSAHKERWSDFWVSFDNMSKLLDMETKLKCKIKPS